MGLILCPECKNEISLKADACPKCGFPLSEGGLSAEQAPINRSNVQTEADLVQLHDTLDLRTSDTFDDSLQGKDGEIPLIRDKFMSALETHQAFFYFVADAMGYSTTLFGIPKKPEKVLKEVVARLGTISEIDQVYWMAMGVSRLPGDGHFAGKLTIGECLEELEDMMKRGVGAGLLTEEEYKKWSSSNTE